MASPLGKELESGTIRQHINNLLAINEYYGSPNYRGLMNIVVINEFFNKLKMSKANGGKGLLNQTLRGYISSFKHLIRFFKIHNEIDMFLTPLNLEVLSESLTNLSVGLKKGCQIQNRLRENKVQQVLPTTAHLRTYLSSKLRNTIIHRIIEINNGPRLTPNEMVLINGFIFCEISMDNANRAGELKSMTIKQFNKATIHADGTLTVKIRHHKTYYKYGDALVTINKHLRKLMTLFEIKLDNKWSDEVRRELLL
jgi:hypothetical protein